MLLDLDTPKLNYPSIHPNTSTNQPTPGAPFCTVNLILMRRECGSVHTKLASTSFTLLMPLIFLRHSASSWRDSSSQCTHGGRKYLPHPRHQNKVTCLVMPSVMSTCDTRAGIHGTTLCEGNRVRVYVIRKKHAYAIQTQYT
jgi:hypothetical protein